MSAHAPFCRGEGANCAWEAGAPYCGCNCHVDERFRASFPLDGIDHYPRRVAGTEDNP